MTSWWIVMSCAMLMTGGVVEGRLNLGLLSGKGFLNPTEFACEGYPIVLRCPGTDVIEVVEAQYGRQNAETCATSRDRMHNTNCRSPDAVDVIRQRCNNRTQCKITVSDDHLADPCPGTYKYLQVNFKCLKYMFGCPGTLTGIGSNTTLKTTIRGEAGSWSKDPVYNPGHVFYAATGGQLGKVQEYASTDDFINGADPVKVYNLPSAIQPAGFIVHDGHIFYVKVRSRHVIKFRVISRVRVREATIPGNSLSQHDRVRLAADERGLWAIYAGDTGRVAVSRLNKDTLLLESTTKTRGETRLITSGFTIAEVPRYLLRLRPADSFDKETWETSFPKTSALHSFMICGVLYVVGSRTGEVEYMYDTNLDSGNGKSVSIGFDRNRPLSPSNPLGIHGRSSPTPRRIFPSSLLSRTRSFRQYNLSSLVYNPRERLLYAWDASGGVAVYYRLHFDPPTPAGGTFAPPPHTTGESTSRSTPEEQPPPAPTPTNASEKADTCPSLSRSGLEWPATAVGDDVTLPCPDASGGTARWTCGRDGAALEPAWLAAGPDLTRCATWWRDIDRRLQRGDVDAVQAAEELSRGLSAHGEVADVVGVSRLVKLVTAQVGLSAVPLTLAQAQRLAEGVTVAVQTLLGAPGRWAALDDYERYEAADNVMVAMEEGGAALADAMATTMAGVPGADRESEFIEKSTVRMFVNVQMSSAARDVVFPGTIQSEDHAVLPSASLLVQSKEGFSGAVVAAYDDLGGLTRAGLIGADPTDDWRADSGVLSVATGGHHLELPSPVILTFKNKQSSPHPRTCAYWSYSQGVGGWSTEGCHVTGSNQSHTECSCNHVTSFIILVNVAGSPMTSPEHALALDVTTMVGICVSLACLAACIVTFVAFRNLQGDRNTIHKHLCICLFLAELLFLVGINQTGKPLPCAVIAGLLHYLFLAAFVWMALEGFQLYVMLVEVFEPESRWRWFYLAGYGVPAVIVGVSAAVGSSGYGSDRACWLKTDAGFIWSFVGPVCAVVLCNLAFLAVAVAKMYRHSLAYTDASRINALKSSVRGASVLLCLLGVTWAFGILWIWGETPVMGYLFCICNAFQGLFIFVFHCLFQKKVRSEYARCFSRLHCCGGKSHDPYMSNSMSFSKQYTPARYPASQAPAPQSQLRRLFDETMGTPSQAPQEAPSSREPPQGSQHRRNIRQASSSPQLTRRGEMQLAGSHEDELFLARNAAEIGEEAYDRLQRHCHPSECGYDSNTHHTTCAHVVHSTTHHGGAFQAAPRPHPRSQTMNPIKFAPCRPQQDLRLAEPHRASTLANTAHEEWGGRPSTPTRRFSQPVRYGEQARPYHDGTGRLHPATYRLCDDAGDGGDIPPEARDFHPAHRPPRRRSLNSSESDDPVVNDFSASSSTGSKPSSLTGTMGARYPRAPGGHTKHQDHYIALYRDEADLEVQRLTGPDRADCEARDTTRSRESQRDSAFYQSMPDLHRSPGATPASSGCSPEAGGADPLYARRPNRCVTAPRYVLAPTQADFQSVRGPPDTPDPSTTVKSHGNPPCRRFTPDPPEPTSQQRSHGNQYEDATSRMMTSL